MEISPRQRAFKLSIPIFFAYFFLGVVFSIVFNQHFNWYMAPVMSLLVYAGAVQIVAVSMLADQMSLLQILVTTSFIALRNAFYALPFLERFEVKWYKKLFLMYGLVDATYALMLTHQYDNKKDDEQFCWTLNLLIFIYWQSGTLVGAIFGEFIPQFPGMEFILMAFFAVVIIEQYIKLKRVMPFVFSAIACALAIVVSTSNMLLIAITLTAGCLVLAEHIAKRQARL